MVTQKRTSYTLTSPLTGKNLGCVPPPRQPTSITPHILSLTFKNSCNTQKLTYFTIKLSKCVNKNVRFNFMFKFSIQFSKLTGMYMTRVIRLMHLFLSVPGRSRPLLRALRAGRHLRRLGLWDPH